MIIPKTLHYHLLSSFFLSARTFPPEKQGLPCKDKSVRLCTVNSAEFAKCSWLKQVVLSQGIEPKLNCVQSYSMWSCFDLIKKGQADIVGIDTDYSFIAKKYSTFFHFSTIIESVINKTEVHKPKFFRRAKKLNNICWKHSMNASLLLNV